MGFFEDYKKQIITIATILLILISLFTVGKNTHIPFLSSAIGYVVTPLQKITTTAGNWITEKTAAFQDNYELAKENEDLKTQLAILEDENSRLSLYQEENKKLSELLAISQKYADFDTTGTQIIAKDPGNWYDIFTIDKGKKDGIGTNMVLTAPGGLVGRIIETGHNYAKAQSILDNRSSVPAMSLRTNDLGVVHGDYELMDKGLCIMEYINADAEIIEGDEIVTSHLSDVYPPGIAIGRVKEIKSDSNGLTKYAIIEPLVDFKHLDTVLIITDKIEGGAKTDLDAASEMNITTDQNRGETAPADGEE